jgi:hypothetical protein
MGLVMTTVHYSKKVSGYNQHQFIYVCIDFIVSRVNWLRARARHQRWEEEIEIVKHEMIWTQLWFEHQQQVWERRRRDAAKSMSPGHEVYAAKQVWVWTQFWEDARKSFADVHNE